MSLKTKHFLRVSKMSTTKNEVFHCPKIGLSCRSYLDLYNLVGGEGMPLD